MGFPVSLCLNKPTSKADLAQSKGWESKSAIVSCLTFSSLHRIISETRPSFLPCSSAWRTSSFLIGPGNPCRVCSRIGAWRGGKPRALGGAAGSLKLGSTMPKFGWGQKICSLKHGLLKILLTLCRDMKMLSRLGK